MKQSEEQRIITEFALEGESYGFVARAGGGKTTTIFEIIKSLLEKNPQLRICVLSFSNAIINSIKEKLTECGYTSVTAGTIHSLAMRLLNERSATYKLKKAFKVTDIAEDAMEFHNVSKKIRFASGYSVSKTIEMAKRVQHGYPKYDGLLDVAVQYGYLPKKMDAYLFEKILASVAKKDYKATMSGSSNDFDDCIIKALTLDNSNKFDVVIVDEFQDSNVLQTLLFKSLKAQQYILCYDPQQRIYGFNGALTDCKETGNSMLGVNNTLRMSTSFRCSKAVAEHVKGLYVPDFTAFEKNLDGSVTDLDILNDDILMAEIKDSIVHETETFLAARKNSTLLSLFMRFLTNKVPVTLENGNIGASVKGIFLHCAFNNTTIQEAMQEEVNTIKDNKFYSEFKKKIFIASTVDLYTSAQLIYDYIQAWDYRQAANGIAGFLSASAQSGAVKLLTKHRTKGREASKVLLATDEIADTSEEEVICLPYVSATRTKDKLIYLKG
jgi:superfamily I DNA/RNA helicase